MFPSEESTLLAEVFQPQKLCQNWHPSILITPFQLNILTQRWHGRFHSDCTCSVDLRTEWWQDLSVTFSFEHSCPCNEALACVILMKNDCTIYFQFLLFILNSSSWRSLWNLVLHPLFWALYEVKKQKKKQRKDIVHHWVTHCPLAFSIPTVPPVRVGVRHNSVVKALALSCINAVLLSCQFDSSNMCCCCWWWFYCSSVFSMKMINWSITAFVTPSESCAFCIMLLGLKNAPAIIHGSRIG